VATLLSWVLRLFMALMGLVFLLGLVAALCLYVLWAAVRWLLTGRKPQVVMVWQQFSTMRKNFGQGGGFRQAGSSDSRGPWGQGPSSAHDDQVVDVEVREVREDAPRLPSKRPD
jgi:uncharacterized membrane protein YgcG